VTETSSIPVAAGAASTALFVASMLPMLVKAWRTRDMASYSLGNLLLANTGNAIHSVYVFSLPPGPIWALHSFYVLTTATMLVWFLRYGVREHTHASDTRMRILPDADAHQRLLASVSSDRQEA
jgi:hypothetical protein